MERGEILLVEGYLSDIFFIALMASGLVPMKGNLCDGGEMYTRCPSRF